ncbi:MAG: hypothetical protein HC872_01550 [Gammaproteobacteria bacterium]|nr:hypothetical protein [Gammaproteobacteria bacterium]
MNKREFIGSLGMGVVGMTLSPSIFGAERAAAARGNRNYAWITLQRERTLEEWQREFAIWRAAGIDGVIAEVYDGRQAYYPSQRLPVKSDRLGLILPAARAERPVERRAPTRARGRGSAASG